MELAQVSTNKTTTNGISFQQQQQQQSGGVDKFQTIVTTQPCNMVAVNVSNSERFASFRALLAKHWHATITYCAVFWAFGMCVAFLGPTLLDLGCTTSSDMRAVSWVFLAQLLCSLFGASSASYLVRRCEANYILMINTMLLALCMFIIPFCQVLPALAFVLAVMGFNMGCVDTLANLQMINVFGETVPPFLQVLHFCYGLGAFVSPMIAEPFLLNEDCSVFIDNGTSDFANLFVDGGPVDDAINGNDTNNNLFPAKTLVEAQEMTKVRFAFWIMAVLMAPIPGIVLSLRLGLTLRGWRPGHTELISSESNSSFSSEHQQQQQQQPKPDQEQPQQQQQQLGSEYGTIAKLAEEKMNESRDLTIAPATSRQRWLIIAGVASLLFIFDGLQSAYGGFVYSYAVKSIVDLSRTEGAYLNALFWGTFAVGRLFSIPLATWFSPSFMLLCNILGSMFSLTLMLIMRHDHVTLYVGTCLFGLFLSSIAPTSISVAETYIEITPTTTSILVVVAALGEMACPVVVGNMFSTVGPGSFLVFCEVMALLSGVVYVALWFVGRQTPKHLVRGGRSFIWSHMCGVVTSQGHAPQIQHVRMYIGKRTKSSSGSNIELDTSR